MVTLRIQRRQIPSREPGSWRLTAGVHVDDRWTGESGPPRVRFDVASPSSKQTPPNKAGTGKGSVLRLTLILGIMFSSLILVWLGFRSDSRSENTLAANDSRISRESSRSDEPYITGMESVLDPNAPGNDDREFLSGNDHVVRPEDADLGPDQSGSAQALVDNSETLRQGAEFADLPTSSERLANAESALSWDTPSERTWGEDTRLDGFEAIENGEYVALDVSPQDEFTPLTRMQKNGRPYSSIPVMEQAILQTNQIEHVIVSSPDEELSFNRSAANKKTNDDVEMTQSKAVKLSKIEVPSDYTPSGTYVDSGEETLGQGTTPF